MKAKDTRDPNARFQKIRDASRNTGLSMFYLREGCKAGKIPHIMCGTAYYIDVPQMLETLEKEAVTNAGGRMIKK